MYWWVGPVCSPTPQSSCISIKPAYSTSSVIWLMLMPVRSDIEMLQKWHKWRFIEIQNYVSNWYDWRTRQESNLRPSVPQTMLAGIQGQTATNKDNNINIIKVLHYCHISPNVACFCKLMAQNWHKYFPLLGLLFGVSKLYWISGLIDTYMDT